MLVVKIEDYAYRVPFVEGENGKFFDNNNSES